MIGIWFGFVSLWYFVSCSHIFIFNVISNFIMWSKWSKQFYNYVYFWPKKRLWNVKFFMDNSHLQIIFCLFYPPWISLNRHLTFTEVVFFWLKQSSINIGYMFYVPYLIPMEGRRLPRESIIHIYLQWIDYGKK